MSIQDDILDAVVTAVSALSLTDPDGSTPAVVAKAYFPELDDDGKDKLRVFVTPGEFGAEPLGGGVDTLTYEIDIVLVRVLADVTAPTEFESLIDSKRAIMKALLNQHLTAVTGGPYCQEIAPTPTYDYERMKARNQFVSVVNCTYVVQETH